MDRRSTPSRGAGLARASHSASRDTRERVFRAAAELGYRPDAAARVLARTRSRLIGVTLTMRNAFHVDLVEAIYPAAERLGYEIVLGALAPTRDEPRTVETLLGYRSEALILLGPEMGGKQLGELGEMPVVAVGRGVRGVPVDVVRTADERGVRQSVDHLVSLGHREIVCIDGGRGPGAAERRRGYRSAMRRHGLGDAIRIIPGDQTEESGARAARGLLSENRLPTALVASNDRCATGALDSFIRSGLDVPGEVSIVGYDDSQLARLAHVNLTSVRQNAEEMAELAVRAAVERLEDRRAAPRDHVLSPQLVVRGTTGPVRPGREQRRVHETMQVRTP